MDNAYSLFMWMLFLFGLAKWMQRVKRNKMVKIVKEQIDVVGGCPKVYKIVDENLRNSLIEFSLLKESLDLHRWRKHFVRQRMSRVRTYGENPETMRFERFVEFCYSYVFIKRQSSTVSRDESKRRVRMDRLQELFRCGPKSDVAWLWKHHFLTPEYLTDSNLSYSDVARILFEHYKNSPFKLEELAMKTAKKERSILSEPVKRNDKNGFFRPETYETDLKAFSKVGQAHLQQLKKTYDEMRQNAERKVRSVQDLPRFAMLHIVVGRGVVNKSRSSYIGTMNVYRAFHNYTAQLSNDLSSHLRDWGTTRYILTVTIQCQTDQEGSRRYHVPRLPPLVITNVREEFPAQFEDVVDDLQSLCQCRVNIDKSWGWREHRIVKVAWSLWAPPTV